MRTIQARKTLRVAQVVEAAVCADKDFLRDVLRVLLLAQHTVGDTHSQSRRMGHSVVKLTGEVLVDTHQGAAPSIHVFMHRAHQQDAGHA